MPPCSPPDGNRLIHALRNEENPPRDSPGVAAHDLTAASPNTEKPRDQIPKERLCCALRGFSMLREKVSKGGEWHLKKSYCNWSEFSFDVDFFFFGLGWAFSKAQKQINPPPISLTHFIIIINTTVITWIFTSPDDSCTAKQPDKQWAITLSHLPRLSEMPPRILGEGGDLPELWTE